MSFVCAYTCELNELVWAAATARRGEGQGQEQARGKEKGHSFGNFFLLPLFEGRPG